MTDSDRVRKTLSDAIDTQSSDLRKALELAGTAYSDALSLSQPELLAHAAYVRGGLLRLSGVYPMAESLLQESLKLYDSLQIIEPKLYIQLGQLYVELQQSDNAIALFKRALELYSKEEQPLKRADTLLNLANAYVLTDLEQARSSYEEAMMLYAIAENEQGLALTLSNMGGLFQTSGQHQSAVTSFREAARILESQGEHRSRAIVLQKLADSYLFLSELSSALSCVEEALSIAGQHQLASLRVYALRTQAEIFRKQGKDKEASDLLEEAEALAAFLGLK